MFPAAKSIFPSADDTDHVTDAPGNNSVFAQESNVLFCLRSFELILELLIPSISS